MALKPHSPAWYDRLSQMQEGYHYPWQSTLSQRNGEDIYLEMVCQHLLSDAHQNDAAFQPSKDVLDVGCGHGDVAIEIAPLCKSILAYDRIPSYIELAQTAAQERDVHNVAFLCTDSSIAANHGQARIPAEADSFDLLISRRGPLHWLEDARRVARPGATLIQLNPMETSPPIWNTRLPEPLRLPEPSEYPMRSTVEYRLSQGGLELHSCWTFDVPETFAEPQHLYAKLTWGFTSDEVPSWSETAPILEQIFQEYAKPKGLVLRFCRLLWRAVVDK